MSILLTGKCSSENGATRGVQVIIKGRTAEELSRGKVNAALQAIIAEHKCVLARAFDVQHPLTEAIGHWQRALAGVRGDWHADETQITCLLGTRSGRPSGDTGYMLRTQMQNILESLLSTDARARLRDCRNALQEIPPGPGAPAVAESSVFTALLGQLSEGLASMEARKRPWWEIARSILDLSRFALEEDGPIADPVRQLCAEFQRRARESSIIARWTPEEKGARPCMLFADQDGLHSMLPTGVEPVTSEAGEREHILARFFYKKDLVNT